MTTSFTFDPADFATIGALGQPGQRLFVLQLAANDLLVTLKVEKGQVAALCSHLGDLVLSSPRPGHLPEDLDLRPAEEVDWTAGAISASYDSETGMVSLLLEQAAHEAEGAPHTGSASISRELAAALAIHGTSLVEAGRPPCPLCGYPIDPRGHACPRTNGNRPPQL